MLLTHEAEATLFENPLPAGYVVLFKPRRGVPWVELGKATTMLEALAFVNGKGMFWVHTVNDETISVNMTQRYG